ncbi:MAG: RimK family alpha-L-glutamate ligase [Nanoarchaeota archaeon]|nr:RimK family alpha-L-glutamate ligase [Nanoarchaeota archaeon]
MRLGVISLGGTTSQWIAQKALKYFNISDMIDIKQIFIETTSKRQEVYYNKKPLDHYDCIYIRGSFKYNLLQTAITTVLQEQCYLPLKAQSFNYCHNKFSTLLALHKKNIPIPTTHYAPNVEVAKKILENVNYPIIIKIPMGTQGKGVMFADSIASAKSVLDAMEIFKQPFLIQEYIETGATDTRAIVVGNKVIAAMKRRAIGNELRANIHMGGSGKKYELDFETERIAIETAKAVGAEICGVDILEGNKKVVIEVNTSPGLKGISATTDKDLANSIAKYLYTNAREFAEKQKKATYSNIIGSLAPAVNHPKEIITNLDIRAGKIKLPAGLSQIAGFNNNQEIYIKAQKGKIEIKEYNIKGGN